MSRQDLLSMELVEIVGWVERQRTHRLHVPMMGFASLTPSYALRQRQHGRRCLHLLELKRAALERDLVAPPQLHVPVLVDVSCGPRVVGRKRPVRERKRDQG